MRSSQQESAARHIDGLALFGLLRKRLGPSEPRWKLKPYTGMKATLHSSHALSLMADRVAPSIFLQTDSEQGFVLVL